MAINLSTPSEELIRTLDEEHNKACYWLRKHYGGDKGYDRMRDELLYKAYKYKKTQRSEYVEYKSTKGNRWLVFEEARYYPNAKAGYTNAYAFCYYETYGSVGLFLPANNATYNDKAYLIFTSHFFQRWCDSQRKMDKMMGRQTIVNFLAMFDGMTVLPYTSEDGRKCVDVRICETIGRGVVRKDSDKVFEVRTVLTDKMLSSAQRRFTKELRECGDIMNEYSKPFDVRLAETMMKYNEARNNGTERQFMQGLFKDQARVAGCTPEEMEEINIWFAAVVMFLSQIKDSDFDYNLANEKAPEILDTALTLREAWSDTEKRDGYNENVMIPEMMKLAQRCHIGISNREFNEHMERVLKEAEHA